jgi:hypothetical protein
MATIVTRSGKGSPLTNNEVDANFTNLNTELGTKVNASSLAAVATSGAYADLSGRPTNVSSFTNDSGYLTSFTEADPTVPSHVKAITTTNISNWNTAFGWGNHASAGYLTGITSGQITTALGFTPATAAQGAKADTAVQTIASTDGSVSITGTTAIDLSVAVAGSTSNVLLPVRNTTGATLTKGTAVYISGATGQISTVSKAIATGDATSAQTLGLVTANIANNANGNVTLIGTITNIDTSAYTDGQQLYLSPTTAGTLTATKPYAPQHLVYVAVVEHAHPSQGKLFVKVQNGYEMDELHDVSAQNPSNNHGLFYNTTSGLWENKSIVTALGYTPYNATNPSGYLSTVSLTSNVTGTLPVANGGTGATSLTSGYLVKGNGTSAASASVVYDTGTNVGIGTSTPNSKLEVLGGTVGTTAGNEVLIVNQRAVAGTNSVQLLSRLIRASAGTDWTTTTMRLQGRVDATNFGYIDFVSNGSQGLVFGSNTTERMRIDSSGNVGIGASSANSKLYVYDANAAISTNEVAAAGSGVASNRWKYSTNHYGIYVGSVNAMVFYDYGASAERMRIDGSGNVGIGTSSPNSFKLNVQGNVYNTTLAIGTDENLIYQSASNSLGFRIGTSTNQAYMNLRAVSGIPLIDGAGGVLALGTAGSERARIDSSGNVLVATTGASWATSGRGNITIGGASSSILSFQVGGADKGYLFHDGSNVQLLNNVTGGAMLFNTNATERMRIDATGNVGIGTTTANSKLVVGGASGPVTTPTAIELDLTYGSTTAFNALKFYLLKAGSETYGFGLGAVADVQYWAGSSSTGMHRFFTSQTERFAITSTGGITSSALADAVGYKGLPQNQRTSAYTLALSDIGKHLYVTAGAFAVTIPADGTLNFPVGATMSFVCEDAAKTIVPASGVTLVLAGTGAATTGTRTLAIGAVATLIKVQANRWYISGSGVT